MSEYTKQLHYTKDNVTTDITLYDDSEDLEGVKLHIQDGDNEVLAALVETDVDVATDLRVNYNGDIYAVGAEAPVNIKPTFEDNTPEQINAAVVAGIAQDYWDIGDKIPIELNGYVSDGLTFDHETYYAFIIDFDHNMELESEGKHNMHMQFGKTADDVNIAFTDSGYNDSKTSGTWFNMNNSQSNSGGWKSSRMRTVICPAFLNAMPISWQNIITFCTKYTDNTGGGDSNNTTAVTASYDKIWLLAEYEAFGVRSGANQYEQDKQTYYSFYATTNKAATRYRHNNTNTSCNWWLRSPYMGSSKTAHFCFAINSNGDSSGNAYVNFGFSPAFQIGNSVIYPEGISPIFNNNTPAKIKEAVESGEAVNYWDIGDKIAITLNGTVGNLTFNNKTYYAFILGFNHNKQYESKDINSIHLQFAKTLDNIDLTFVDSKYNSSVSTTGYFSMNSTQTTTGGWESSQMNTIIGPAFYNALPVEWQNVISDCPKYTDNIGGTTNAESNVTSSQSKIWLLSEYEVFGTRTNANTYEQNYQSQYDYYFNGYSKIKYKHNANTTTSIWKLRSPRVSGSTYYCAVNTSGNTSYQYANYSGGFSPGFAIVCSKLIPTLNVSTNNVNLDSENKTATITITYNGDGKLTAQSENETFISTSLEGNQLIITYVYGGNWVVTVFASEGKRYMGDSVEISVVSPIIVDPVFERNIPKQINAAALNGVAADYWDVGDKIPIELNGTLAKGVTFDHDDYYAFIIGFNHNSDIEGNNTIHMQFGKTSDGKDIAFVDSDYGKNVSSIYYNNLIAYTNNKPWSPEESIWVTGHIRNLIGPRFFNILPQEWKDIIISIPKYTKNVNPIGGMSTANDDYASKTRDKIWILSQEEMISEYETDKQKTYPYYKNNSPIKYKHNNTTSNATYFVRTVGSQASSRMYSINANGSLTPSYLTSYGFTPAFAVGKEKINNPQVNNVYLNFEENTPQLIQYALQIGVAQDYWDVGDKIPIELNGQCGALLFDHEVFYAFIIGFNHNIENEYYGMESIGNKSSITLQFAKTIDGKNIAFCDNMYDNSTDETNTYADESRFCMEKTVVKSNEWNGWKDSYMRNTICNEFFNCLPDTWKNVISKQVKYEICRQSSTTTNYNLYSPVYCTYDYIYIPSIVEFGRGSAGNDITTISMYQKTYRYYVNTNRFYKHTDSSISCNVFTRSNNYNNEYFTYDGSSYKTAFRYKSLGFMPCFTITEPLPILNPDPIFENNSFDVIQKIVKRGDAENYWDIGDSIPITLNGQCGRLIFNNENYRAFIMDFDHNLRETRVRGLYMQLGKALDSTNIAFVDDMYGEIFGDNSFVYSKTPYTNKTVSPDTESYNIFTNILPQFLTCLPNNLQKVIVEQKRVGLPVGLKIWLLSKYEVYDNDLYYASSNRKAFTPMTYYQNNTKSNTFPDVKYKHNNLNEICDRFWLLHDRTFSTSSTTTTYSVNAGLTEYNSSNQNYDIKDTNTDLNKSYGFVPCFVIG